MKAWLLTASEQLSYEGSERRRMRTGLLARALLTRGHRVTWWKSTFEHVSKKQVRIGAGFEEVETGLTVGWIPSRGYDRHVSLSRALDHRELGRRFLELARARERPDVVVCSLPVPELALAGVRYGATHGVPVVVDIRDWWPDALLLGLPPALRPVVRLGLAAYSQMVAAACRGATAITGIAPAFVEWGLARAGRSGTPRDREFPHAYQTPAVEAEEARSAAEYWESLGVRREGRGGTVAFIGSVTRTFDFSTILAGARLLMKELGAEVRIVVCGDGDRLPQVRRSGRDLPNVVFNGAWVGPAVIQELLRRSAAGLVPLPNRADFLATVNNKTVEYLSAGLPLVVSPENSWVGALAGRHGFGACWDGQQPEGLARAIRRLLAEPGAQAAMGQRARAYFEEHFVADRVYGAFAEYLERIIVETGIPADGPMQFERGSVP